MNDTLVQKKALRILIVDDNREARAMLKQFLRSEAGAFRECEDGAEALAAYHEFQPDWVLMDCQMKRMNGIAATRQILAQFPEAAILIVTNHDELELRRMAEAAGARGFVLKHDLHSLPPLLQGTQSDFAKSPVT